MDGPTELPIVYTTTILIPGDIMKIPLKVKTNSYLLHDYLKNQDLQSTYMIGAIPKKDFGKINNVIGTMGKVRSVIQRTSVPDEFILIVQGIQRFLLGATIFEEPMQINQIILIDEPFKELMGDEYEIDELKAEFENVLTDFFKFTNFGTTQPFDDEDIKAYFEIYPLHEIIKDCLNNIIVLTQNDKYEVLRAKSLNALIQIVIDLLKQEILKDGLISDSNKSPIDRIPFPFPLSLPTSISSFIVDLNNSKFNLATKNVLSEVEELHTTLINSNMPTPVYDLVLKDLKKLEGIPHFDIEYSILVNYINYVINLPWNKTTKETLDLEKAKNILQKYHYGMDKVKKRILQFIAVRILNPNRRGPILCFVGPPGIGKTSIVKTIANSLNRTFKKISLGGIHSYSDIKGHQKTYKEAMPGCIIQAINQSQTTNPLILLDEIDKMNKGSSGGPAAALLDVLDPEQNTSFVDSYINIPYDISQVMFIATANDVKQIPRTLRDRMEIIKLDGYSQEEKVVIAEKYMIPKILKNNQMDKLQITILKNTINDIITKYTSEIGVRELQRKIEAICHSIAVKLLENEDEENKIHLITPDSLMDILGNEVHYDIKDTLLKQSYNRIGVAIGLSWTSVGGKIQVIETSEVYSNTKKNILVLTGLAGPTLKESAEVAFNWINEFAKKNELKRNDLSVHVHFSERGHKKDEPSAGITIACALTSLFWKIPLKTMVAMTGEMSLQGHILPVGGIKHKICGAYYAGIKTVIIPEHNLKETKDLPKSILEGLNIIPVKHIEDVLAVVFPGGLSFFQNPSANIVTKSKI